MFISFILLPLQTHVLTEIMFTSLSLHNNQSAIDAPRFCILDGTRDGMVYIEEGFHESTVSKLKEMGHKMKANVSGHEREIFGRAQIIHRDRDKGVLCAGSDGRADGCALGY